MKLVRFGPPGLERPGVWLEGAFNGMPGILDVRAMAFDIEDYDPRFFARWGVDRLRNLLLEPGRKIVPGPGMRLGCPVARPAQIICVGKNFADHAAEMGTPPPPAPLLFGKAVSALNGPGDAIMLSPESVRVDAEAELAVVIGRRARRISEAEAPSCIAGYTILNDVSDRDAQFENGQWFRGKSFDSFCPVGPYLVTPDEIPDPGRLRICQRVGSEVLQDGNTSQMIFSIAQVLVHATRNITLEPGDIVATGTPSGIGSARTPPRVLKEGDVVEIEIEGLGLQRSPIAMWRS